MFVLKDEIRTARKFYACDASEMWCNYGPPSDAVTTDDRLVIDGAKADKWKIRPGQRYRCVVFRDGRELVTQRARLDMDALCQRHVATFRPDLHARLLDFGRRLKAQEPRDDFPDDYEV